MSWRPLVLPLLLCATPALADGFAIPLFGGPDPGVPRSGYREAAFPPPQHNLIGQPVPPPSPYDRPSYREQSGAFPPPAGRFGGGALEYIMTGGRPEPLPQPGYAAPSYGSPAYAAPAYAVSGAVNPVRASLPHGGLPDYSPALGGAAPVPAPAGPSLGDGLSALFGGGNPAPVAASANAATAYDPLRADLGLAQRPIDPAYQRQEVDYAGRERAGTIIIDTPAKFLYLVEGPGRAIRYGIGVGRPGFAWSGVKSVSRKAEWPGWTPPPEMLRRRPDLPRHMVGGEANPLGARALYLGSSMYRIHGTNEPYTIGTNVSSGCIRMMNQDVIDLYGRVGVGTRVVVL